MTVFEMIAGERRAIAELVSTLTEEQLAAPSLVPTWTVRDVAAHLTVALEVGKGGFLLAILRARGDFNKAMDNLTWRQAKRRTVAQIADSLRRNAENRFTPPGMGPEAPLTDLLVHGLDMRVPLKIAREIPEEKVRTALKFLAERPVMPFVPKTWRAGLRFEATNLDFAAGAGKLVRGHSDALLSAIAGRRVFDQLEGEGVEVLRRRYAEAVGS